MCALGFELMGAVPQQRSPVPLGLAADVEVLFRDGSPAAAIHPGLVVQEEPALQHRIGVERAAVLRQRQPLFQQQHALAGLGEVIRRRRSAGAGTDDDYIEAFAHGEPRLIQ